ncbi:MAG: MmgE/PrpD family protein, partial [Betaproteobacteria bacterium]
MERAQNDWDETTRRLISFAAGATYERLGAQARHEVKRHVLDSIACALGAYDEPVCALSRSFAANYYPGGPTRIWGSNASSAPDVAAFVNGVMTRALDLSDTCL